MKSTLLYRCARRYTAQKGIELPGLLAARVAGREKRPLGDVFGLPDFGVNLTYAAGSELDDFLAACGATGAKHFVPEGRQPLTNVGLVGSVGESWRICKRLGTSARPWLP